MAVRHSSSPTLRVSWRGDNNLKLAARPCSESGSKHLTGAEVLDGDCTASASPGLFGDVLYFREIQACRWFFFFLGITINHTLTVLHLPIAHAPCRGNEAGDGLGPGRIPRDCRSTAFLHSDQIAGINTTTGIPPDTNYSFIWLKYLHTAYHSSVQHGQCCKAGS